ncbi:hypothetical protein [Protofrankia coriariae]|nr:hypothetical protein [Protofrankia coriariae]
MAGTAGGTAPVRREIRAYAVLDGVGEQLAAFTEGEHATPGP